MCHNIGNRRPAFENGSCSERPGSVLEASRARGRDTWLARMSVCKQAGLSHCISTPSYIYDGYWIPAREFFFPVAGVDATPGIFLIIFNGGMELLPTCT